jgi:hypothetical protein
MTVVPEFLINKKKYVRVRMGKGSSSFAYKQCSRCAKYALISLFALATLLVPWWASLAPI